MSELANKVIEGLTGRKVTGFQPLKNNHPNRNKATHTLNVGDIMVAEWGATMQLIDFYQVVKLIGKSTIELKGLNQSERVTGFLQGYTTPIPNDFLAYVLCDRNKQSITRRVFTNDRGEQYVKIGESRGRAYKMVDGKEYFFDHCD